MHDGNVADSATFLPEVQRLREQFGIERLVMVGDGPLRQVLEESFGKRKVLERVVFTGTMAHEDVAAGRFDQAEFAADLYEVHVGEADEEYRDPMAFFARVFTSAPI